MSGLDSDKKGVALMSVAASAVLTIAKLIVGLMSGSLAVLAEAGHSFLDFCATVITYFAVRASDKPADDDHHYGHGKVESLAALAEVALLFLLAGFVIVEGIKRLMGEVHDVPVTPIMIGVLVISIAVDFWRSRALKHAADEHQSDALAADALHFFSDMLSSGMALLGLIAVYSGFASGDAVAAIAVAIFICFLGFRLGRETVHNLMDSAPSGLAEKVREAVTPVAGIVHLRDLRLRKFGPEVLGEMLVDVSRALSLERVAAIKQAAAQAARAVEPRLRLQIMTNPVALDDESILERVHLIARARNLAIHHVTVHQVGETIAVGLDLEVDGAMPLSQAHAIADDLQDAISADLGQNCEVEAHIEPLQTSPLSGVNAPQAVVNSVQGILSRAAEATIIVDVHNVRVRETPEGMIVHFHCRLPKDATVNRVHDSVDLIEHALRKARTDILRVVSHAEPIRE